MSEPKRYRLDPESYLAEHPQGDFVDYQDYARLKAEVDNLRKNADISPSQSPHEIAQLKAEVESLKAKINELPTRRIGDKWYTEGEFQVRINDVRAWHL